MVIIYYYTTEWHAMAHSFTSTCLEVHAKSIKILFVYIFRVRMVGSRLLPADTWEVQMRVTTSELKACAPGQILLFKSIVSLDTKYIIKLLFG